MACHARRLEDVIPPVLPGRRTQIEPEVCPRASEIGKASSPRLQVSVRYTRDPSCTTFIKGVLTGEMPCGWALKRFRKWKWSIYTGARQVKVLLARQHSILSQDIQGTTSTNCETTSAFATSEPASRVPSKAEQMESPLQGVPSADGKEVPVSTPKPRFALPTLK